MMSFSRWLPLVFFLLVTPEGQADDAPATSGVLTLRGGDTVAGTFHASEAGDFVRWQGEAFVAPFEFVTPALTAIRFPAADPPPALRGEFAFELVGGDVLSGRVVDWADGRVMLESPHFGTIGLRADAVRRMYRLDDNPMLVFSGPSGLTDWTAGERGGWKEDGPHVWTDQSQSLLTADLGVPERAVVEFELSWTGTPNFVFAVGADPQAKADSRLDGWRFETWGGVRGRVMAGDVRNRANSPPRPSSQAGDARKVVLALVREHRDSADVDALAMLTGEIKRIHLIAYLDQAAGTMQVFLHDGTPAGQITVPPAKRPGGEKVEPGRGVRIVNRRGDVKLERLRIARWNGVLPSRDDDEGSRFELADGSTVAGEIAGFDPKAQQFRIHKDGQERAIAVKEFITAEMSPASRTETMPVSAILQDGTRVLGRVEEFRAEELVMAAPDLTEPVVVPHRSLRSLVFQAAGDQQAAPAPEGRLGRLELDDRKLSGRLVAAREQAGASCLAWHPVGSRTGSPLKPKAAGRIVYRDPPPPVKVETSQPVQRRGGVQPRQNFAATFLKKIAEAPAERPQGPVHNIHLVSGDVIPCTVLAIDEQGVHIDSPVAEAKIVPHEKIKAAELTPGVSPPDLQSAKKERLLTVPRLQKASPPTHLLHSRTGDFLRCRLIALRDDQVVIELQLDEVEIPRDRVSQIIWFHADEQSPEPDGPDEPANTAGQKAATALLAQIIQPNGNRVTFLPQEVDGQAVAGRSDVLGACRFPLEGIDQLIFGKQIDVAAAELAYHQWRLQPAVEPLVAQDFDETGSAVGTVSPLVGKPAPDIDLELLAGGRFKLSNQKGKIVVLDFWASWCGPCMQTMPLMEEAMQEFDENKVRLVSVNLEEPAGHVKSVLERHKLNVTVALDIDGVAARRYEANAIPQLVIVAGDGTIARLYVGGGRNVVDQVKASIAELLGAED